MRLTRRPGYTLVEFLIYIAIVSAIVVVASSVVFMLLENRNKLQVIEEVSQNGRLVLDRLALEIRNADAIVCPLPGATSSRLVLTMPSPADSPTQFSLVNGALTLKEGTAATTTLTADEVTVRSAVFKNLTATGTAGTIRIELAVSSTNPNARKDYDFGQVFRTTFNLRKRL